MTEKATGSEAMEEQAQWGKSRVFPDRKLLVLDLDETLVHSVARPELGDYQLTVQTSPVSSFQIGVRLRPFVKDFLSKASQLFEIAIFTSAQSPYANTVIDFLDPAGTLIQHRLYRDHCKVVDGLAVKDLQLFRGVDLKDIIICDNLVGNFRMQLNNGVPIKTWTEDREDKELVLLLQYLMKIARVPDVRVVNQHFFHLDTLLTNPAKSS